MPQKNTLESFISRFPEFIRTPIANTYNQIVEYFEAQGDAFNSNTYSPWFPGENSFVEDMLTIWSRSDYVRESSARFPEILYSWSQGNSPLYRQQGESFYFQTLQEHVSGLNDEEGLMSTLRRFRREEMMRLMARDVLGRVDLKETLADVSSLADASVVVSLSFLYGMLVEKYGRPLSRAKAGKPAEQQYMLVMAMGKHGAKELNVSSDIDLIFAYPESGENDAACSLSLLHH